MVKETVKARADGMSRARQKARVREGEREGGEGERVGGGMMPRHGIIVFPVRILVVGTICGSREAKQSEMIVKRVRKGERQGETDLIFFAPRLSSNAL